MKLSHLEDEFNTDSIYSVYDEDTPITTKAARRFDTFMPEQRHHFEVEYRPLRYTTAYAYYTVYNSHNSSIGAFNVKMETKDTGGTNFDIRDEILLTCWVRGNYIFTINATPSRSLEGVADLVA